MLRVRLQFLQCTLIYTNMLTANLKSYFLIWQVHLIFYFCSFHLINPFLLLLEITLSNIVNSDKNKIELQLPYKKIFFFKSLFTKFCLILNTASSYWHYLMLLNGHLLNYCLYSVMLNFSNWARISVLSQCKFRMIPSFWFKSNISFG